MASDVPSHVHFDFESDIPDLSGAHSSGGGVGDPGLASVPNPDAPMAVAEGDDLLRDDHGFVDMQEFGSLTARVVTIETTLTTINTNITNLSALLGQYMLQNTPPGLGSRASGESIPIVMPPPAPSPPVDSVGPSATQEGAMIKNLKPPVFKGEERDRNKDAVHTFLHKWADLHRLRRTPTSIMVTETSLTLEGKAYKWWMSLPVETRPTDWREFEAAFWKEFLPQNEKDQNWTAWDKCRMEGLTLNQYVSKY